MMETISIENTFGTEVCIICHKHAADKRFNCGHRICCDECVQLVILSAGGNDPVCPNCNTIITKTKECQLQLETIHVKEN